MKKKLILLNLQKKTIEHTQRKFDSKMDFYKFCIKYKIGVFYHWDGSQSILCLIK